MSDSGRVIRSLDDFDVLILPGWGSSGPTHWQTHWESAFPKFRRVVQDDWETPAYAHWAARLNEAVARCRRPIILVAHSLGTTLTTRWALERRPTGVAGAFLVAPTDRDAPVARANGAVTGFGSMMLGKLPFPSMVVASSDDDFVSIPRAMAFARAWGSSFVNLGPLGHIGSAADLGLWPSGLVWFGQFLGSLQKRG